MAGVLCLSYLPTQRPRNAALATPEPIFGAPTLTTVLGMYRVAAVDVIGQAQAGVVIDGEVVG